MKPVIKKTEKLNPREIHQSYLSKIEGSLEKKGVVFFDPQTTLNITEDYLTLPGEITEVPSRELGEYLNAFTQQKVYMRTLLGRVEILVEEAKRKYFEASEPFYKKYSSGKLSETAKERMINSEEEVKQYYYEYVDCKSKLNLIQYSINNIEDIIFMLSREVTRRTGDFNDENRAYNVGRK